MMTTSTHRHTTHRTARKNDPIRIVPLFPPEAVTPRRAAPAAPTPQLTYNNGPLLANVKVFTVFWGAAWNASPLNAQVEEMNQFFQFILTSALIDQLAEYSTPDITIGHGTFVGTTTLTKPAPRKKTTDAQIQSMLRKQIAGNAAFPKPDADTLYFVFLPSGVEVDAFGSASCQPNGFCGYHDAISGSNIFYAVVPSPDCSGCSLGSTLDSLTVICSHELCEAITDPIPGQGWYWFADQNNQGEIGDICEGGTKQIEQYTVQLEWSNKAKACV